MRKLRIPTEHARIERLLYYEAMDAALRDLLERKNPRVTLVLGASDTGKTTLVEQLLSDWNTASPTAVVDCDVGQSRLGPPTTIGWGLVTPPFEGWHRVAVRGMAFTGSVSPESNVETFLHAASRMVQAARLSASRLLVDTTGLVTGELGVALKTHKVVIINPDLILALQRDTELEPLLAVLPRVPIERLAASPECARRSLSERAAYRDKQFARYFANSVKHRFALDHLRLIGVGPDWPTDHVVRSPAALLDRVVGLQDAHGEDLALGLVRECERTTLAVMTPLRDLSAVTTIAVGSIRWPTAP